MYLIIINEKDVLAAANSISMTDDGFVKNNDTNVIYGFPVKTVEVDECPTEIAGYQYTYTEEDGLQENESYVAPGPDNDALLRDALAKISELEDAVCELTILLEEGK